MEAKHGVVQLMIENELKKLGAEQVYMKDMQALNPLILDPGANEFIILYQVRVTPDNTNPFALLAASGTDAISFADTPDDELNDIYFNDVSFHRGSILFDMDEGYDYRVSYVRVNALGKSKGHENEVVELLKQIANKENKVFIDNRQ